LPHVTAKHTHTNTRTHTHTHIFRTALQPVSAALPRTTVVTPTLARTFGIVKLLHEDRRRARGTATPGERVGRDVATRDSGGRHSSAPPRRRHMLPHRRGTPAAARRRTDAEQSRGQRQRDTVRGHAGTRGGAPYPASPIAYIRLASSNIAPSCVEATPKAENGLTHEPCRGSCPISATAGMSCCLRRRRRVCPGRRLTRCSPRPSPGPLPVRAACLPTLCASSSSTTSATRSRKAWAARASWTPQSSRWAPARPPARPPACARGGAPLTRMRLHVWVARTRGVARTRSRARCSAHAADAFLAQSGDLWGSYSAVGFGGPGKCTMGAAGTACPNPSDFYAAPDTDLPWSDSAGSVTG